MVAPQTRIQAKLYFPGKVVCSPQHLDLMLPLFKRRALDMKRIIIKYFKEIWWAVKITVGMFSADTGSSSTDTFVIFLNFKYILKKGFHETMKPLAVA
jgi:hypothetical protein